jgi:hypothetical protein
MPLGGANHDGEHALSGDNLNFIMESDPSLHRGIVLGFVSVAAIAALGAAWGLHVNGETIVRWFKGPEDTVH